VRVAGIVLATAVALAVQTTLARFVIRGTVAVDPVLVVVVYVALSYGSVTGLLTGTFAGLAQDITLSSGLIGVGGLAKSIVGFLSGIVGTQFIVTQTLPRFVVFFGATVLHQLIFNGLYAAIGQRDFSVPYGAILGQSLGNAVVGVVAFQLAELLPGAVERRKLTRTKLRR